MSGAPLSDILYGGIARARSFHSLPCLFIQASRPYTTILNVCLQYFIYCCILGLVSCSVFLRINYELKMVVMLVAVVIYNIIILQTHASLLDGFSKAPYPTDTLNRYLLTHTHTLSSLYKALMEELLSPLEVNTICLKDSTPLWHWSLLASVELR